MATDGREFPGPGGWPFPLSAFSPAKETGELPPVQGSHGRPQYKANKGWKRLGGLNGEVGSTEGIRQPQAPPPPPARLASDAQSRFVCRGQWEPPGLVLTDMPTSSRSLQAAVHLRATQQTGASFPISHKRLLGNPLPAEGFFRWRLVSRSFLLLKLRARRGHITREGTAPGYTCTLVPCTLRMPLCPQGPLPAPPALSPGSPAMLLGLLQAPTGGAALLQGGALLWAQLG